MKKINTVICFLLSVVSVQSQATANQNIKISVSDIVYADSVYRKKVEDKTDPNEGKAIVENYEFPAVISAKATLTVDGDTIDCPLNGNKEGENITAWNWGDNAGKPFQYMECAGYNIVAHVDQKLYLNVVVKHFSFKVYEKNSGKDFLAKFNRSISNCTKKKSYYYDVTL